MSDSWQGPRPIEDESSGSDAIGRILRQAGHRPPVPAEDAAMVKAAAFAQWQQTVEREKRRRLYLRGGAFLAAAAVLLLVLNLGLWQRFMPGGGPAATVETMAGVLHRYASVGAAAVEVRLGEELDTGSILETGVAENASRAALRLADGQSLRLDEDTRLRLLSPSTFELERGAIYVDSGPGAEGSVVIHTPLGSARDIGTRFEVRLSDDGSLLVRVRDGSVVLERDGASHLAEAGVELTVEEDGTVRERQVAPGDAVWGWTLGALPRFEVEGQPLTEFLDWMAYEGGWELRFADPELEAALSEVILHGTISGLSLEEAATLSLLGSGLEVRYRVEDGVLILERLEP